MVVYISIIKMHKSFVKNDKTNTIYFVYNGNWEDMNSGKLIKNVTKQIKIKFLQLKDYNKFIKIYSKR